MSTVSNTPFIPLQGQGTSDAESLGLKAWMGEVAGAYFQSSVTEGLFRHKSIAGGLVEAQWIVAGRRGSVHHKRGDDLLSDSVGGTNYVQDLPTQEVTVRIDRALSAASFLDNQDSVLQHFDAQSEMRRQGGQTISRTIDERRMICVLRGAHRFDQGSGNEATFITGLKPEVTTGVSPTTLTESLFAATSADASVAATEDAIATMAERFDDLEVPAEDRMMFVKPSVYWYMVKYLDDYIDTDFRGEGSKAKGIIKHIHGFRIVKTTNLPDRDIATNPTNVANGSIPNDYRVKGEDLGALFATPDSIAEVRLGGGWDVEAEYETRNMGMLVNPYWIGGMKELRPEACGAIYTAAIDTDANYTGTGA